MASLQLPATSQTPPTVCSGGTSPSLTCLRSATVNSLPSSAVKPQELAHQCFFKPATRLLNPPFQPLSTFWCQTARSTTTPAVTSLQTVSCWPSSSRAASEVSRTRAYWPSTLWLHTTWERCSTPRDSVRQDLTVLMEDVAFTVYISHGMSRCV